MPKDLFEFNAQRSFIRITAPEASIFRLKVWRVRKKVVPLQPQVCRRRDARVVEWTALEMRRTLTGTLGSNPSLSAENALRDDNIKSQASLHETNRRTQDVLLFYF